MVDLKSNKGLDYASPAALTICGMWVTVYLSKL